jgi:hypothetical protein
MKWLSQKGNLNANPCLKFRGGYSHFSMNLRGEPTFLITVPKKKYLYTLSNIPTSASTPYASYVYS